MKVDAHHFLLNYYSDPDDSMADTTPGPDHSREALLIVQVAQGELQALEQLFTTYQRRVYQFAIGITRDAETAEEVVQDTFYRLYCNAYQIDAATLLPWLYRVAANLSYNRARAHGRWITALRGLADRIWDADRVGNANGSAPEVLAEQHELQAIVRATLDTLSPRHRAVLVLHYMHEYTIEEVAAILNCPEGTVKSRLYHARRLLKEQLQHTYGITTALLPDSA